MNTMMIEFEYMDFITRYENLRKEMCIGDFRISYEMFQMRSDHIKKFGFCYNLPKLVFNIEQFCRDNKTTNIYEVMAGSAMVQLFFYLLNPSMYTTIDYRSSDNYSSYNTKESPFAKAHPNCKTVVKESAVETIKKIDKPNSTVCVVWPPYDTSDAADMVKEILKNDNVQYLIYVGEGRGGCTADDDFFEILDEKFEKSGKYDMLSRFDGIYDNFYGYRKK